MQRMGKMAANWRGIGFDLPDDPSASNVRSSASTVVRVLTELRIQIDQRGATARELLLVVFSLENGSARVALREPPLAGDYPSLCVIFREIARACAEDCIGAHQLRCIMFEEDEVKLMLIDGRGQPESYVFPVRPAETS